MIQHFEGDSDVYMTKGISWGMRSLCPLVWDLWLRSLFERDVVLVDEALAVVATERGVLTVDDVEAGSHRLVVGDALGVVALDDVDEVVRQGDVEFLDHLIVSDDVDHDIWCDDSDAVECLLGEDKVCDLDDTLLAHAVAVEVVADGDADLGEVFESEQVDDLKQRLGGDMVDHSAVLQRSHCEFFLFFVNHLS